MKHIYEKETNSRSPVLMCSAPGFDPSFKVEALAKELSIRLISVAIGSEKGFEDANSAINEASGKG